MSRSKRRKKIPRDYATDPRWWYNVFIAKRQAQVKNAIARGDTESLPVRIDKVPYLAPFW